MKIAMIGQKGIPATFGGIEKHVEELSARLVKHGHEVTVFCRPYYTQTDNKALKRDKNGYTYRDIKLKFLPTINSKHLDAITHSALSTFATLFKGFDIIHYHALGPSLLSFIPRLAGNKVVCTVHGLDWQRAKWQGLATRILQCGELATVHFPQRTIVVSKTLKKYYWEKHQHTCDYIPNGQFAQTQLKPDIIKKYNLKGNDYLLFVGRLVPEKGCHYLIEAFKKTNTTMRLIIVGGSSHSDAYQEELYKMAQGDERIIFTGYVYGDELNELYSNCYLFLLPSEMEGLPLVLLEALSYGCAALVSDIPENMEVIASGNELLYGYKFASKNAKDLQSMLEMLIASPQKLAPLREKVGDYILTNYNWDTITSDTIEVYKAAIAANNKK